jgi:uncharacterized protein YdcH (DUF465 family)
VTPTDRAPSPHQPWPRDAKLIIAILAVAALLAVLGTFLATRGGDEGTTDQQDQIELLTAEQARLTSELETANARVAALTDEIDALDAQIADLDAQLATATTDVDELTAQRVSLTTERAELQASLAAAEAEVAALEVRLDTAADVTATLDERIAVLDVRVGYLIDRATAAEQERDALLALFPIEFDSSLQGVDLAGVWRLTWDDVYCTGFGTCGNLPAFDQITISQTPEGWLRASATGVFDAGLFEVEGALYANTDSVTAAPRCGVDQRIARVGLTLYASGVSVAEDGTHVIEDLGATYVVDAPATATCPNGIAVYGAQLTAVG